MAEPGLWPKMLPAGFSAPIFQRTDTVARYSSACRKVVVDSSEASRNGHSGIEIRDCRDLKITGCTAHDNTHGILFADSSAGNASKNSCVQNKETGILVSDTAQPVLEQNTCNLNQRFGIHFADESSGEAYDNTCDSNNQDGICIGVEATPEIEQEAGAVGIRRFGIHFEQNSMFAIKSSRVTNSECHGNITEDIADRRRPFTKPWF